MTTGKIRKASILITLVIAGEAVFFLPFVVPRIFRPTFLDMFGISNIELGRYFSVYGIVAMVSYALGGPLADRFPARNLMALALCLTSLGGFFMAWVPSAGVMMLLYGFWGMTTILLFWSALIRATREWGGTGFQGRAFGWLEGGRGAIAAVVGTVTVFLFSWLTPGSAVQADPGRGLHPLQGIILIVSGFTFASGIMVWVFVPAKTLREEHGKDLTYALQRISAVIRKPAIRMLAVMVVCAYAGYKITDDFSLYSREVLGFSEVGAASAGASALWLRAVVAVLAGIVADRLNGIVVIGAGYAFTLAGSLLVGFGLLQQDAGVTLLFLTLTATGIYSVRTLYFAVLEEARIPVGFTGTAVGIISFIGFTPEIFMGPVMGHLLDNNPGPEGHEQVFLSLAFFAFVGWVTTILFARYARKNA